MQCYDSDMTFKFLLQEVSGLSLAPAITHRCYSCESRSGSLTTWCNGGSPHGGLRFPCWSFRTPGDLGSLGLLPHLQGFIKSPWSNCASGDAMIEEFKGLPGRVGRLCRQLFYVVHLVCGVMPFID